MVTQLLATVQVLLGLLGTKLPVVVSNTMSIPQDEANDSLVEDEIQEHSTDSHPNPLSDHNHNTSWFQQFRSKCTMLEVSGMCGDFGTLFPLLIALTRERRIYLAPTLFWTGWVHMVTGVYWDLPMPLQPMHMISAQALAHSLDIQQVTTAGIGMGLSFFMLQCGGIETLNRWIPKSVLGGLQLGVGWKVVMKGIQMIRDLTWWGSMDCIVGAILLTLLVLYGLRSDANISGFRHLPVGLLLCLVGLILATIQLILYPSAVEWKAEPLLVYALQGVTWDDWKTGFLNGTLPQLPLTTLNSCLSVCLLAQTLFPEQSNPVSRKSVCRSIGWMNTLLCPFGLMPHCHGAGGLAGQHRLGATSGVSMVLLGLFKLGLSLLAAQGSLLALLGALPVSVLGILLALSGQELAMTGVKAALSDQHSTVGMSPESTRWNQNMFIALVTAAVIVATGKAHVGTLCGWVTYMVYGSGVQDLCFPDAGLAEGSRQSGDVDGVEEEVTVDRGRGVYNRVAMETTTEEENDGFV
eukprot:Nitzschia sp. Nitz4//scaffold71_size96697//89492//91057//NITZ4_004712-RA/size96697-processed-gene-0.52-mRNA-1//-1//CDS//3329557298//8059//frame0